MFIPSLLVHSPHLICSIPLPLLHADHRAVLVELKEWLVAAKKLRQGPVAHQEWHYKRYRDVKKAMETLRQGDLNERWG